ncbi:MAG: hypothetical protein PHS84_07150 [Paludibacter sp.]|jgi:hypothetical protein|nr:hypothetical protein [Paludibacter sp.]
MMDFISIPLVVGIITLGIYKLFDLFVRKKERLAIIEKIGDKFDSSMIENKFSFPFISQQPGTFGTLKIGLLLLGVGLGLLVGFFICQIYVYGPIPNIEVNHNAWEISGVIYGASVLLFGGLGLLIAFFIEMKYLKDKKAE